jgi:transient receptor potential cation channel subfamily V protein 6
VLSVVGTFFLPRDQSTSRPVRYTNYEGLAYLGEYHLAWAACYANESIYNSILEKGGNPDARDTFGNTVLHMVVVWDRMV